MRITEEAVEAAVKMSARYINERFLPDKAIDLIDEASSKAKLKVDTQPEKLKELEEGILRIQTEKEEMIGRQEFEKAALLRDEENVMKGQLEELQKKWENSARKKIKTILEEDIAEVIAKSTGIPVQKISQNENSRLKNLEKELGKRVIGQYEAVLRCF